jgi:putative oxidoreductase
MSIIPAAWSDKLLAVLRITTGLAFLHHGTAKFFGLPFVEYFKDGVPLFSLLGLAGILELVGGVLIIVGLFTRVTAFVLSGMAAVAYFMAHGSQGFFPATNGGEAAYLYTFIFLFLAAAGAGAWSIDGSRKAA